MVDGPSLMSFVLARLDEDFRLVMADMPLLSEDDRWDPSFAERFMRRNSVVHRIGSDQSIVGLCAAEMERAQAHHSETGSQPDAVTAMGTQIIKLIAARYSEHPEYQAVWVPD